MLLLVVRYVMKQEEGEKEEEKVVVTVPPRASLALLSRLPTQQRGGEGDKGVLEWPTSGVGPANNETEKVKVGRRQE